LGELPELKAQLESTKTTLNQFEKNAKENQLEIDHLKESLKQHQSEAKSEFDQRESSMSEWKASAKKDLEDKVLTHHQ
jgi:regulator of replication initiation timing